MATAKVNNRGREVAATVARKASAFARKGVAVGRAGAPILLECLRLVRTAHWLVYVVGNDDAASPAHTVLAAIVQVGEILASLAN